ncbi:MAG: hypothetical protein QOE05_3766 [Actinomycetota bacterium]|jgi:hypothetical protein|nr:hypothetical protein [Actinomycetota bacterium]
MRRSVPLALAAAGTLLVLGQAGLGTTATAAGPTMTFTPATVVDPILFGGEPGFTFDPTTKSAGSRSFVDWPVSSRTQIGVLFRSEDGGLSYTKRYMPADAFGDAGPLCISRQVPYCPAGGGGDTDIDINPTSGTVGMGEQEVLVGQALGVSLDHGTTFPASHVDAVVSKTASGVDRQWQASWAGTKTRFLTYHVPIIGNYVHRSDDDGAIGSWTAPPQPQIQGVTQSGSFLADNSNGPLKKTLYVGYLGAGGIVPGAIDGFAVAASTDGAKTFQTHQVPDAKSPRNFTTLSIDNAGNLYAVWVESTNQQTWMSTSKASDPANRKAPASKWSPKVQISKEPLTVTIFANTAAGSPGRVAIGYYGTTAEKAKTPDAVKKGQGGWYPYVAYSSNALCWWDKSCSAPKFSQDKIAHRPNHDTNICTSGTACAANPDSNRNLLDYFAIDVDKQGHLGFVWSDTNNATGLPFVKVSRQASGPSLYAGKPNASQPGRKNGAADTLGDAKYPIAGAKLLTAKNQKALDLASTTIGRTSDGSVEVHMKIPGLPSSLTGVVPGGGTAVDDSGTPLQVARFVTRWDYNGDAYYVEATLDGTEGGITYGAGKVSVDEGVFNANPTATLGNTYAPLIAATGTHKPGEIIIKVPASAVGGVTAGKTVYSVGSYALIGHNDLGIGVLQNLPITVDSTPTFDTALGSVNQVAAPQGLPRTGVVAPAPQKNPVAAPNKPGTSAAAAAPTKATPAEETTDSTSFVKVAAVSGGSLAILALLLTLWLQYHRKAHN